MVGGELANGFGEFKIFGTGANTRLPEGSDTIVIMPIEVRKGKRILLDLSVGIAQIDQDGRIASRYSGRLHDLSPGGCALRIKERIPVSEPVQVRIALNQKMAAKLNKAELTARGVVIRSIREDEGYLLTIRFQPAKSKRGK
jgi:c-di-GMP-binding flagellar brake protein YcgR